MPSKVFNNTEISRYCILKNSLFRKIGLKVNSVASLRGGGCHHFGVTPFVFFFPFETKNPLIGRQRPFFLVITYFQTENQLALQRRLFLFALHLYFGRYRVPQRNPTPGATILSDDASGSIDLNRMFIKASLTTSKIFLSCRSKNRLVTILHNHITAVSPNSTAQKYCVAS